MDPRQIADLLERERRPLTAFALAIVRDHHLAEDVVQEAASEVVQRGEALRDPSHLQAWLRRAVRFRAIDQLRRRGRELHLDEPTLDAIEARCVAAAPQLDARAEALGGCLGRLTPNVRQLLTLRFREGLKGSALAERLGRQVNTVHVALSRAYRALAGCIEETLRA